MRCFILVLLGIVCTLNAAAQPAPASAGDNGAETNSSEQSAVVYAHEDNHPLAAGDVVSFQIKEDKKQPVTLVVTDSGELNVPYIGRVDAAGKTCRKLAAELKVLLEKDYYYRATVVLGLETVNKVTKVEKVVGRALIWGEVNHQGEIEILAGHTLTLSEAILRAGGLTDDADKKRVKVFRSDGHHPPRLIEVNIADVMEKGRTDKDITIEPDDYIIVGSRAIRF